MGLKEYQKKNQKSKAKYKYKFLKSVQIRDITFENSDDILNLIKEKFGDNYHDKKFYDENIIQHYTQKAPLKDNIFWKGAFLQNKLVGQAMLEISHGVGFIKLTMISNDYRHSGILTLLSYHLMSEISRLTSEELRYIYAFVANTNNHVLDFIEKYGFCKLGMVPAWDKNERFIIYGRISRNMKDQWRLVDIYMDLYDPIIKIIKSLNLKRYIQTRSKLYFELNKEASYRIDFFKNCDLFPFEIQIKEPNFREPVAFIFENKFQKSWFDFYFNIEIPYELKFNVINEVLNKFNESNYLNSLSLSVDVNDYILQKFLLDLGFKFYAYLPFFFKVDKILMGKSKICMEDGNGI